MVDNDETKRRALVAISQGFAALVALREKVERGEDNWSTQKESGALNLTSYAGFSWVSMDNQQSLCLTLNIDVQMTDVKPTKPESWTVVRAISVRSEFDAQITALARETGKTYNEIFLQVLEAGIAPEKPKEIGFGEPIPASLSPEAQKGEMGFGRRG